MVRFKNRYLLIEIQYPSLSNLGKETDFGNKTEVVSNQPDPSLIPVSITSALLTQVLKNSIETNFGSCGAGRFAATVAIKYHSPHTSLCIVRCPREGLKPVLASIALVSNLRKDVPCIWRIRYVGGTIKKVQLATIARDEAILRSLSSRKIISQEKVDRLLVQSRESISKVDL